MDWRTKLIHAAPAPAGYESLTPSTHRASTTVLPNLPATTNASWRDPYSYGIYGTPTTLDLAQRVAALCGGSHSFVVPSGQAAIALVDLAFLRPGDHLLLPENVYGTNSDIASSLIAELHVDVTYYKPSQPLAPLLRPNTRLVWMESPGSITLEVADVPAMAAAVREHNAKTKSSRPAITVIDDTYSAGVMFRPFDHGIDIAVQALTKYLGGHSDIILGTVTLRPSATSEARDEALHAIYEAIGSMHRVLGLNASPDDCLLAIRGMQTLHVRLEALERSTLEITKWLEQHPAVDRVLHPALPSSPGHAFWKRDFTGSASLVSFTIKDVVNGRPITTETLAEVIDRMKLFKLGYSWGGVMSVVMAYPDTERIQHEYGPRLIRLGIGLEETKDLIADLERALSI